jgi:tetrapyrrole methylase family protein / MazG family protein
MTHPPSAMDDLIRVIATLRGPGGCPWDREQTPRSMGRFLLEEAYELADAVESGTPAAVREELGDVLFHVLFLAMMFAEGGHFDLDGVCRTIADKMRRRHPHVFGSTQVKDSAEVVRNWQEIKRNEKGNARRESVLDAVPASLPGLLRAFAVSERAARARFDWKDLGAVMDKLEEELSEFRAAAAAGDAEETAREFGDILFTLVNVARFSGVHPESALTAAVRKFERRFRDLEKTATSGGRELAAVSQAEKDRIWDDIKRSEPGGGNSTSNEPTA